MTGPRGGRGHGPDATRVRLGGTVAFGCAAAVLVYALLRTWQRLRASDPDPALVLFSAHAGFFWRALLSAHAGGMAGLAAWFAGGRDGARAARLAAWLVPAAAVAIALTGALVP